MITLQNLTVKDAYKLSDENPILAKTSDDISLVIKNFSQHGELRGIFVIDDNNQFLGVITRVDLFDWARVKLGAYFLKPQTDSDKTIRLVNLIHSSKVGDILRPDTNKATVQVSDSLKHALEVMIETDLIVLPVVDNSNHILGSVTISELLNMIIVHEDNGSPN